MKWLVLLVAVCLLAVPVAGTQLDFQSNQMGSIYCDGSTGSTCAWAQSTNGENSYINLTKAVGLQKNATIRLRLLSQSTYAAFTGLDCSGGAHGYPTAILYDAAGTPLYTWAVTTYVLCGRFEVNISGGIARIYRNGAQVAQSGALGVNPSAIAVGQWVNLDIDTIADIDDYVYGSTEVKYILGMPEEGYYLKKDLVNPASSGFTNPSGVIVNNQNMTTTWGKGIDNTSIKIKMKNGVTGVEVCNYTTTAGTMAGSISWPLEDCFFNNPSATYGLYRPEIDGSGEYADYIEYKGDGATISFDRSIYSQQDTAHISYEVLPGGYWNTALYAYRMDVISANTGSVVHTDPLTLQTGTVDYTFTDTDEQGSYYAAIIATRDSDGEEIWMNAAVADLSGTLTFSGYVNDAETGLPISGANVTYSQDDISDTTITIADGNYTATGFITGGTLIMNTTAAGYSQEYFIVIPEQAKSIVRNISLNSTTPSYTELGVGGIVRDGILTGNTITKGYGRPVEGAGVIITNESNGEYYGKETSMTGWYLCDAGSTCTVTNATAEELAGSDCSTGHGGGACEGFSDTTAATVFTQNRLYTIFANKLGYLKSQNYTVMFA